MSCRNDTLSRFGSFKGDLIEEVDDFIKGFIYVCITCELDIFIW